MVKDFKPFVAQDAKPQYAYFVRLRDGVEAANRYGPVIGTNGAEVLGARSNAELHLQALEKATGEKYKIVLRD